MVSGSGVEMDRREAARLRFEEGNGESFCPVADDWPIHRREAILAMQQVQTMHSKLDQISEHTSYLRKLDPITNTLKLFVAVFLAAVILGAVIGGKNISVTKNGITTHTQ